MALTAIPSRYRLKNMKKSELRALCSARDLDWEGMDREELIASLCEEAVDKHVRSKNSLGIALDEVLDDLAFSEKTCEQLRAAQKQGLVNEKNVVGLGNSLKFPGNLEFISDRIDRFKLESFIRRRLGPRAKKIKPKKVEVPLSMAKAVDLSSDSAFGSRTTSESLGSDDLSSEFNVDYHDDEMPPALEIPSFLDDEETVPEAFDDEVDDVEPEEEEMQPVDYQNGRRSSASHGGNKRKGKLLWKFIVELLRDPAYCPSAIRWQNRDEWIFEIVRSKFVATLWGTRKGNIDMDYDKLSRALRQYYETGILICVPGRRLTYQFGPRAIQEVQSDFRGGLGMF